MANIVSTSLMVITVDRQILFGHVLSYLRGPAAGRPDLFFQFVESEADLVQLLLSQAHSFFPGPSHTVGALFSVA